MKVREPVPRPLDVVAAEMLLSASQAFLTGVLLYLAVGIWDDRGVGFGPVAIILALLGAAVGGSWLYWMLGGVGWPLAAANVPTAMFLGFALVLGWMGDDLFRVEGVPLLLSLAAAVYGIVCGVFLDSPRRWRWDQRQKPRPGTVVPRVSPATRTFVAAVPRSLPRRPVGSLQPADILPPTVPAGRSEGETTVPYLLTSEDDLEELDGVPPGPDDGADDAQPEPDSDAGAAPAEAASTGPLMPTERLDQAARAGSSGRSEESDAAPVESGGIELPTSVEPRAQRSPWAWAAPPEWNRDEEDGPGGRSSTRR